MVDERKICFWKLLADQEKLEQAKPKGVAEISYHECQRKCDGFNLCCEKYSPLDKELEDVA